MVNAEISTNKKPLFTILSLTVSLGCHLLAWVMFVWAIRSNSFLDAILAFFAVILVIISSLVAYLLAGISSWRSEPRNDLRLIAYIASILSFPVFLGLPLLYGLLF